MYIQLLTKNSLIIATLTITQSYQHIIKSKSNQNLIHLSSKSIYTKAKNISYAKVYNKIVYNKLKMNKICIFTFFNCTL